MIGEPFDDDLSNPPYSNPTFRVSLFGVTLLRERSGVISEGPCWVCLYGCWMHCCGTLPELIWSFLTEFRSDRHLVG